MGAGGQGCCQREAEQTKSGILSVSHSVSSSGIDRTVPSEPLPPVWKLPGLDRGAAMAISGALWVLMSKVLVMISVIAAVMAFLTIFGLSIPRRLEQWDMAGGRRARCRCDGRFPQLWPTASFSAPIVPVCLNSFACVLAARAYAAAVQNCRRLRCANGKAYTLSLCLCVSVSLCPCVPGLPLSGLVTNLTRIKIRARAVSSSHHAACYYLCRVGWAAHRDLEV